MVFTSSSIRDSYDRMAAVVGPENVQKCGERLSAAPADTEQAAAVLAYFHEKDGSVCVEGSGSKLGWLADGRSDLALTTNRMNRVLEHTWQDMTCTVEAGCTWQAMQIALGEYGQCVALDPLWPARSTVGGVLAANDSGSLRLRYGGCRDLVIGMTLVLADGTIAKSGGKVVKNVAGYDLPKLLCGSFGTLGMISEVTFRLHSIARHTTSISVFAKDAGPLGHLLLRLLDSHLSTQSMQMRCDAEGFALDLRLAALPEVLTAQSEELRKISSGMGLSSEVSDDAVWAAREALFASRAFVVKGTMLASGIVSAVATIRELGGNAVGQAVGIVTANLPADTPAAKLEALRGSLEAEGGSLIVLQSPPDAVFDRWGTMPDSLALMRAVKQKFDPNGVLNPGRFLGRI